MVSRCEIGMERVGWFCVNFSNHRFKLYQAQIYTISRVEHPKSPTNLHGGAKRVQFQEQTFSTASSCSEEGREKLPEKVPTNLPRCSMHQQKSASDKQ